MRIDIKRLLTVALCLVTSCVLFACAEKKTPAEENEERTPADTDWVFDGDIPCGWSVAIQRGDDETSPSGDLSEENAIYAYYDIVYDEETQIDTYLLKKNNFNSFNIDKNKISFDNGSCFASVSLYVTFYYTADLLSSGDTQKTNLIVYGIDMDAKTRQVSVKTGNRYAPGSFGTESDSRTETVTARRIRNSKEETAEVKCEFVFSFKMSDDLNKVTVLEYNDLAEEVKRSIVNKDDCDEFGHISYETSDTTSYVVVEREWTIVSNAGRIPEIRAGETYYTREVLQKEFGSDSKVTTLWYPAENGLCDGKKLWVEFK